MKAAIIVQKNLPQGLIANCSAVLGLSLGARHPEIVGPKQADASGIGHPGITQLPIPVLASGEEFLKQIAREALEDPSLDVIPFNNVAQQSKNYNEYSTRLSETPFEKLEFLGVLLAGPKKTVSGFTGQLPLAK